MHGPIGWIHLYSGFAALLFGTSVVFFPKGRALHRAMGLSYVFAMLALNASALSLYHMTGHFGPFHALALVSLACTLMGITMPILKRAGWLERHALWMGRSYVGLLAAALAEALVRIPALHIDTVAKGFAVGIGAAVVMSVAGFVLIPALKRSALRYQQR